MQHELVEHYPIAFGDEPNRRLRIYPKWLNNLSPSQENGGGESSNQLLNFLTSLLNDC